MFLGDGTYTGRIMKSDLISLDEGLDFCGGTPGERVAARTRGEELMDFLRAEMRDQDCMTIRVTRTGPYYTHVVLEFLSPAA